jgi:hypothetical protein
MSLLVDASSSIESTRPIFNGIRIVFFSVSLSLDLLSRSLFFVKIDLSSVFFLLYFYFKFKKENIEKEKSKAERKMQLKKKRRERGRNRKRDV